MESLGNRERRGSRGRISGGGLKVPPFLLASLTKQRMTNNHYQRSLVDKLQGVHGDTQDMINFIANNDHVCIVSFDFAGLSTNVSDLKEFVR
ncbi:hypothetical protein MFLAVUS_002909 [Mucor flavus]|uniref:Uncharacterized protein n=1 Tax=Mucor flavus TaxID=439312 RepID=A0ABP9YRL3_9FUNG